MHVASQILHPLFVLSYHTSIQVLHKATFFVFSSLTMTSEAKEFVSVMACLSPNNLNRSRTVELRERHRFPPSVCECALVLVSSAYVLPRGLENATGYCSARICV